jgi:phage-related protein
MRYFEVEILKEAKDFIDSFSIKVRKKIYYCINLAQATKDPELFKKISGTEIWEFRILYGSTKYRLFAFWDSKRNSFVVCTHGLIKKTSKTPQKEIDRAEKIRTLYNEYYGRSI